MKGKPLKYGINKVPDSSSTIEVLRSPNSPTGRVFKLNIPKAAPMVELLKPSQQNEQFNQLNQERINKGMPNIRDSVLQQMISTGKPLQESTKETEFKRLDTVRDRIMKTQNILDMMVDEAARRHPGIAEDLQNNTGNYLNEFKSMYPEYDELRYELNEAQNEYMNDPLHEEHFEGVLKQMKR
jgi:hypothetical protein